MAIGYWLLAFSFSQNQAPFTNSVIYHRGHITAVLSLQWRNYVYVSLPETAFYFCLFIFHFSLFTFHFSLKNYCLLYCFCGLAQFKCTYRGRLTVKLYFICICAVSIFNKSSGCITGKRHIIHFSFFCIQILL